MNEFAQPYRDVDVNIYGSTMTGSYSEPLNAPNWRVLSLPRNNAFAGVAIPWEVTLDEFRGMQAQKDKYERAHAGWSSTTTDNRFRGYQINSQATTRSSQSFGSTGGNGPVVWTPHPSGTAIAQGTTANQCLALVAMGVTPAPFYRTYNPGSAITALMHGPITTTATRYLIGRTSATIDVHTTLGTSQGTMHANLTFCVGGALSPLNSTTPSAPYWLFYANAGIWALASDTAAISDAPTQTQKLPNGGAVVDNRTESLEKSPQGNRMYLLIPRTTNRTTSAWHTAGASPDLCTLASVNAEGYDLQNHELPCMGVYGGRFWQRRFVGWNAAQVIQYDGERAIDLNIFGSVEGGAKPLVVGLGGDDSALIADVSISVSGTRTLQKWEYNQDTKGWNPISAKGAIVSGASVSDAPPHVISVINTLFGPSMPYSRETGHIWRAVYNTGEVTWDYQKLQPRGVNPVLVGDTTETSGVHTTPAWSPPGRLAGHPFVIEEIDARLADIDIGGTGAALLCEVAVEDANTSLSFTNAISRTFTKADAIRGRRARINEMSAMHRLQVRQTLTSGTTSPNASGVIYRGISFLDDVVRSPAAVRAG